jgi:mono/diheme cytochrome c family protein
MRRLLWGAGVGLAAGLVALVAGLILTPLPPGPPGPEPGRTLYRAHCATCHGADGHGRSWRARLLWLRPGDLATPAMAALPDQYLFDIVRHGGSSFGKPGMPSFGFTLSDDEIHAVVAYVRALPGARASAARAGG